MDDVFFIVMFMHIFIVGVLYKLVARVLVVRLTITNKIILTDQFAFIIDRQLMSIVMASNEVIDVTKKSKNVCLIFKVDFEKPCDSLNWFLLNDKLRRLGFGVDRWHGLRICSF